MAVLLLSFLALLPLSFAAPVYVGYWGCNPGGHASTIPQLQTAISKGYNVVIFAFYDVDANGNLIPDPGSVATPKKGAITSSSFTYLVSLFGGQNGAAPTLTISASAWAQAMFNNFQNLHNTYGFDGIDIDLENAWGGTPDQVECGLRQFFQLMKQNKYTVSMAPQTTAITPEVTVYSQGSWNSYVPLADTSVIQYVDIVAVQCYNNAVPYNSPPQYAQSLESGFSVTGCPACTNISCSVKLPATKIAFGWPSGPGAAPSGCPGLPGGCPYGSSLTSMYNGNPTLKATGGVMTWAIEWDEYYNWQFITAARNIQWG